MLPAVRDALAAAVWLLRSGQQSREALMILTLAAEVWRQRSTVARLRADRAAWRQVASIAMEKPGEQ